MEYDHRFFSKNRFEVDKIIANNFPRNYRINKEGHLISLHGKTPLHIKGAEYNRFGDKI